MMKRSFAFLALSPLLFLACSSSSGSSGPPPPCNENPWECPSGQTCWPKDQTSFQCLNSGPGKAGSSCNDTVGIPTCGDGLACLQLPPATGTCVPFCDNTDPSHACGAGAICQTAIIGASQVHLCVGSTSQENDAGGSPENDAATTGTSDGGASISDGATGNSQAASGDGGVSAQCMAWANRFAAQCPGMDTTSTILDCQDGDSLYRPIGCGSEWDAYVTCATQATYNCSDGSFGCDTQQSAYFTCQSSFAQATGCSRVSGAVQAECSGATPYAFGCTSAIPQGCVQAPSNGSAATFACCPMFPAR